MRSGFLFQKKGGLGVKQLKFFNMALIMKWLWRSGCDKTAIWREIITGKYGEDPLGWRTNTSNQQYGCSVWRGILKFIEIFKSNYKMKVESGESGCFLGDRWIIDDPLKTQFPAIYTVTSSKGKTVA